MSRSARRWVKPLSSIITIPDEIVSRDTLKHQSWMRSMPTEGLSWWRTRLWPDSKGHLVNAQLAIDNLPGWDHSEMGVTPWSLRLDFNMDFGTDWSFPYDYYFATDVQTENVIDAVDYGLPPRTLIKSRKVYLDVLDFNPPGRASFIHGSEFISKGMWYRLDGPYNYETYPVHPGQHSDLVGLSRLP